MGDDVTSALLQSVRMSVTTRVPFTPRPTTATVAPASAPTVAAEPAVESESVLRTLGDSFIGRAMLGAAGAMAVLSPIVKPVVVAYAQAPARLAPDQRTTVNFLQVRAEVQLRERLLSGSGRVTVDEVAVITTAVDKGTVAPQHMLQLAHDLIAKRGFNGDALAKITDYFSAKQATMAAPLREHAAAHAVAVTGVLANDSVAYTDVKQGAVGDCYFAASAAAIVARDPSFPHRIIEERTTLGGDRFYAVQLSHNLMHLPQGSVNIDVQDSVWATDKGAALYAKNTGGHWFQVLEQAGARLEGNFKKLESGFGFEALSRLTGLQAGYALHTAASPRDEVFSSLKRHFDAGNAMTTGAHSFPDAAFAEKHKGEFVTMHEYAIVDVRGTDASNGVVELYNPWGYTFTVSVDEFARNFLGFSYVDLQQQKLPIELMPDQPAVVRPEDFVVVVERDKRRTDQGV